MVKEVQDKVLAPRRSASSALVKARSKPYYTPRAYQRRPFEDHTTGILVLHWSRQIGKSLTLGNWAMDRLILRPGRLVTVLSNSRDNGAEFALKCGEVAKNSSYALEDYVNEQPNSFAVKDLSNSWKFEDMRHEVRLTLPDEEGRPRTGRIKVLAANPRTARGFTGDLILDEFAHQENSPAIWDAAEPILSANPDFLCRVASTGNGRHNMFYRMASGIGPYDGTYFAGASGYQVSRVSRSEAWKMGVRIYDMSTRQVITPAAAYALCLDQRSYRQNYECEFADENASLLTSHLIANAERDNIAVDEDEWSEATLNRIAHFPGAVDIGMDIGRTVDVSVIWVLGTYEGERRTLGVLRLHNMRFPLQRQQCMKLLGMRAACGRTLNGRFIRCQVRRMLIDKTGIGLGLVEELQEIYGSYLVQGLDFRTSEKVNRDSILYDDNDRKKLTAPVTEVLAMEVLSLFESGKATIPCDARIRADLEKPERVVSPSGRVSIAACRDSEDHADHFWAYALAQRAGKSLHTSGSYSSVPIAGRKSVLGRRTLENCRPDVVIEI